MQRKDRKYILLSFNVEEFDTPLIYKDCIGPNEQLAIGQKGLLNLMKMLAFHENVKTTFFTTAYFAENFEETICNISFSHEIASHTCSNSIYQKNDLYLSKEILEKIISKKVYGLRMPQMQEVDMDELKSAGYRYDASINPTWIPGRYNNFKKSRSVFFEEGIVRIPASVSSHLRIPLFWLSFKNLPYPYFKQLALAVLKRDGYLSLYFHPWEFTDLSPYKIPWFIKRQSKGFLLEKLSRLINDFGGDADFISMH